MSSVRTHDGVNGVSCHWCRSGGAQGSQASSGEDNFSAVSVDNVEVLGPVLGAPEDHGAPDWFVWANGVRDMFDHLHLVIGLRGQITRVCSP